MHQRLGQVEHAETMADKKFKDTQDQAAAEVRAELSTIPITLENMPRYEALLAQVNAKSVGPRPGLNEHHHREFTSNIRSLQAAAKAPRMDDDPATERRLVLRLDAATNEQMLEETRQAVYQSASLLKAETAQRFLGQIQERKAQSHYSRTDGWKEGVRIILGGDTTESTYFSFMKGTLKAVEEKRMRDTMDAFRSRMVELTALNREQANREGPAIAQELRNELLIKPDVQDRFNKLPLPLQRTDAENKPTILREEDAAAILAKTPGLTGATRQQFLDEWKRWHKGHLDMQVPKSPPPAERKGRRMEPG